MSAPARKIPDFGLRCALIGMGGAAGVSLRGFAERVFEAAALPNWEAVMACNLLGSILIGVLYVVLDPKFPGAVDVRVLPDDLPGITRKRELLAALLMTGGLGGLTTFSSFSLDTVQLVENGRLAEVAFSVLGSILLGLGGLLLGVTLQHRKTRRRDPEPF